MSVLTFDFEACGGLYGHALYDDARPVVLCWQLDDKEMPPVEMDDTGCFPYPHEFAEAVERAALLVAHNAKYDYHWLYRLGIDVSSKRLWDTMLAEWVLLGSNPDRLRVSLDASARRLIGYAGKDDRVQLMMEGGVPVDEIPRHWLIARCADDVRTTYALYQAQRIQIDAMHVHCTPLLHTHCAMVPLLTELEREGIYLDADAVLQRRIDTQQRLDVLHRELAELCGAQVNMRSINETAPLVYGIWPAGHEPGPNDIVPLGFEEPKDRRGKPVRGKPSKSWPDGKPVLNKNVIEGLERKAKTKRQKRWIELRQEIGKLDALITKCLDYYYGICQESGGRFNAEYRQGQVATHRLAAGGRPQVFACHAGKQLSLQAQNTPRVLKYLQTAKPGTLIFEADAMQLEFRTAAYLGRDEQALADILDPDFDAHMRTLHMLEREEFNEEVYNGQLATYKAGDKELDERRTAAKSRTFKPLFGGEFGTPEEMRYFDYFRRRYAGIAAWQGCNKYAIAVDGYFYAEGGLRVTLAGSYNSRGQLVSGKTGKQIAPQICNYPVQFFGSAVIVALSLLALRHMLKVRGLYMNGVWLASTTHDSVTGYVLPEHVESLRECIFAAFTTKAARAMLKMYGIRYSVPLGVELKVGKHLGDGSIFKGKQSLLVEV